MNIRFFLLVPVLLHGISAAAMQLPHSDSKVICRPAQKEDIQQLLELINTQAVYDRDKIVILPKKFRAMSLAAGIDKNRYFVAEVDGKIIGYKKLFLLNDEAEKEEVLTNEIRCVNNEQNCAFAGLIDTNGVFHGDGAEHFHNCYDLCIYNGGDFTTSAYRGKGINTQLTNYALLSLADRVKQQIQEKNISAITLLFGLTQANAGQYPGAPSDRTPTIVKSLRTFLNAIEGEHNTCVLRYYRYHAFMPTFDLDSQECKPLADEYSVRGFGCVLAYQLRGSHE